MTLTVSIPHHFNEEISYTIRVILNHLKLPFETQPTSDTVLTLTLPNNNQLIFQLPFFNSTSPETYITSDNIPNQIHFLTSPLCPEKNLPILFGNPQIDISPSNITFQADIIASTFFMLTRWEEVANPTRDAHNRFPANASLSHKENILDRPIVNEYIETIWNALQMLNYDKQRTHHTFEFVPTHDIDHIKFWKSFKHAILILGSSLLKHRQLKMFIERVILFTKYWILKQKDPYDCFDMLMDLSESKQLKSRFYFMSGGITKYDNNYDIKNASKIIQNIIQRQHIVGFHPSYNAYNDPTQWKKEKDALEAVANIPITEGREHYLRFEVPTTWKIWNTNNMTHDLTLSYADKHGFRCGTGSPFPVFDCISRKQLNIVELPLILMDTTLIFYQGLSPNEALNETRKYIDICKKYNMPLTYLAHNSMFLVKGFKQYYKSVLDLCQN